MKPQGTKNQPLFNQINQCKTKEAALQENFCETGVYQNIKPFFKKNMKLNYYENKDCEHYSLLAN